MFFRILVVWYFENIGSKEYIDGFVKDKKLVVFMKGIFVVLKCGFSNVVV